ncbi:DNA-binding transcriptional regulator, FrmR family [Acetitomaculum ruminis DSM 5522]|uniref:DNA-binding transcriptional regulator, FrmR family n=1 Tax=Acetitomaculum ruminis DSM 5522 TaxID=1120918 RepID=A0A1I0WCR5_9FIRM|nr:metal-sensing transcriptional repressor [Acetitomaculum ruminis]SFA86502.1 DNA-binding transcriptional regulator, FrmR family [Acetitomaculum ruminis DSM 5522]
MTEDNNKSTIDGEGKTHVHKFSDGTTIVHSHYSEGTHIHHHGKDNTKAIMNRLSRAIGHMEAIKRMVEDERDCGEILIQLSAVRAAINNTGKVILKEYIENSIVNAIETNDRQTVEELYKSIDKFVK